VRYAVFRRQKSLQRRWEQDGDFLPGQQLQPAALELFAQS
jgi:hypothetical protein